MKVYVPISKENGEYYYTYSNKEEMIKNLKHYHNLDEFEIKEFDIPDYCCGDLMPVEQYKEAIIDGYLTDYDGFGKILDDDLKEVKTAPIYKKDFKELKGYNWVLWFNR